MKIKFLKAEDFVNYYKPAMFIGVCFCDWKCCIERGLDVTICQNEPWIKEPIIERNDKEIVDFFISNPFVSAVVIGGLEPMLQFEEVYALIQEFRKQTDADIVIYTGYKEDEISDKIFKLCNFKNIIVKYGRYIPGQQPHLDKVLGVKLASNNQYAVKIS